MPGPAPPAADESSALFAIHRRLAGPRVPLILRRNDDTAAICDSLLPAAGGHLLAVPLLHRSRRLHGALVVGCDAPGGVAAPDETLENELMGLADLAVAAMESAQRLHLARRDQERLQLLAEASEEALWDWNLEREDYWWGGGIQKLLGPGDVEVQFLPWWKLERIHPDDAPRVRRSLQAALADLGAIQWQEEYRFLRADGSVILVEDRGYILRESHGRAYRMTGSMRDITAYRRLLARETEARAEAERANRAKDEFLAMLGHELRNPLAPILTATELLRLRGASGVERERTVIERQARHMVRLVDDLLDVSRVATGKIELQTETVDLGEVVAKAIEMASPIIEERRHHLHVKRAGRPLLVEADPARLAQVLTNLLANAAKYTRPAGNITVTLEPDGDQAEVVVADNGIGIDRDMLPRIFDMFVQSRQSLDRSQGGLGLGLTIARNLVTLHGGTLTAHSEGPGHGSQFRLRLDLQRAGAEAGSDGTDPLPRPPQVAADEACRILVVDDNEDAGEMLGHWLTGRGHEVRLALDGPAALRIAAEFAPEIVLLDLGLPVMDGFEVARTLRQRSSAPLLLIALTGYGQERDRNQVRAASFDAHLVKPVDGARLEQVMAQLSAARRQQA